MGRIINNVRRYDEFYVRYCCFYYWHGLCFFVDIFNVCRRYVVSSLIWRTEMKLKYVRFVEKTKKGYADTYDGVVLEENKTTFVAVVQGPDKDSHIRKKTFAKEDWFLEIRKESDIKLCFDLSVLKTDKDVIDSEFELHEKKINKNQNDLMFKEIFK